jgi:hypothetical protein
VNIIHDKLDTVHLHILQSLNVLVAGQCDLPVKGVFLARAFRHMFNIHLISKSPAIGNYARASLSQVINHLRQRVAVPRRILDALEKEGSRSCTSLTDSTGKGETDKNMQKKKKKRGSPSDGKQHEEPAEVMFRTTNGGSRDDTEEPENVFLPSRDRSSSHGELVIPMPVRATSSYEMFEVTKDLTRDDVFILFRSLVVLSRKEIPDSVVDPHSIDIRARSLALELLWNMMNEGGFEILMWNRKEFELQVRRVLIPAILDNLLQGLRFLMHGAARFLSLIVRCFGFDLRKDVQLIIKDVFLRLLESEESHPGQKRIVVECLDELCQSPESMYQITRPLDVIQEEEADDKEEEMEVIGELSAAVKRITCVAPILSPNGDVEEGSDMDFELVASKLKDLF